MSSQTNFSVSEFFGRTSAHGLGQIANSRGFRRLLWFFLTFGAFAGFSFHLTVLTLRYSSFPKSLENELQKDKFVFPNITICPVEPISAGKYENYFEHFENLKNVLKLVEMVNKQSPNESSKSWNDLINFAWRANTHNWDIYKLPQDQILYCQFMHFKCDFRNFTVYKHPTKYICFVFVPHTTVLIKNGPGGGLKLLLHIPQAKNDSTIGLSGIDELRGFAINVHAGRTRPSFKRNRIIAKVGTSVNIGLEMFAQEKLNTPKDQCDETPCSWTMASDLTSPWYSNVTFTYTPSDCTVFSKQNHILDKCGCLDDLSVVLISHALKGYRFCYDVKESLLALVNSNPKSDPSSILQNKDFLDLVNTTTCHYRANKEFEMLSKACSKCYLDPCNSIHYKTKIQASKWPPVYELQEFVYNDLILEKIQEVVKLADQLKQPIDPKVRALTKVSLLKNSMDADARDIDKFPFVYVNIYAESLNVFKQMETYILPFEDHIANVGGILGLWIGFSIITLCEFAEFILSMTVYIFNGSPQKTNNYLSNGIYEI